MKKIVMATALSLVTLGTSQAGMHLNVMGGMNFANITVEPAVATTTYSAAGAISGGVTLDFGIAPMLAFEIGALSVGQSVKITSTAVGATGSYTRTQRAIEIPVMFRFTALPMLDLGVGGYYGMLPSKYKIEKSTITGVTDGEYTVDKDTYETTDYGLRFGARFLLPMTPMARFLVDASYNMGLKDIDKTAAGKQKGKEYSIMAGASFGF